MAKPASPARSLLLLLALAAPASGCRPGGVSAPIVQKASGPVWFEDITELAGLSFNHEAGPTDGKYFIPQIMGSGAALFDFDNDGRLDILLLQNGGPNSSARNKLFHQEPDGHFRDVSAGSGLDLPGYWMGVAIGDVNNDGWPDVLLTAYRGVKLFLNNGNGTFRDVTRQAGLESPLWGASACFVDYDRDGWLDLVVTNYVDYVPTVKCNTGGRGPDYCHPSVFQGSVTNLYRNLGRVAGTPPNSVRFEDVTLSSGLGRLPGPGLGVGCADFNGDGWPDIFIANDSKPNHLWINQRNGTFKEEALIHGVACNAAGRPEANMGVALGDVNGHGLFDLFVTHLAEETHTLWVQQTPGFFHDRTGASRLASPIWRGTGFGTVLVDFDHDGALDLAIVNGRVVRGQFAGNPSLSDYWNYYAERNQLFVNDGTGRFTDISPGNEPFCGVPRVSRGLACGDIDGDGAIDLLVTTIAGPARLYRNIAPKKGHWLLIRALDPALHRDAYGATIMLEACGRRWKTWINPGQSYLSSNDPRAHFGLGPVERVDRIHILWPDGKEETFPGCAVDQILILNKGQGQLSH